MQNINTPETDAQTFDLDIKGDAYHERVDYPDGYGAVVEADFARRLERERDRNAAALKLAVERIKSAPHSPICDHASDLFFQRSERRPCDCWRSRALAEIEAELEAERKPGAAMRAMIANEEKLRTDLAALRNAAEGMRDALEKLPAPSTPLSIQRQTALAAYLALQPEGRQG